MLFFSRRPGSEVYEALAAKMVHVRPHHLMAYKMQSMYPLKLFPSFSLLQVRVTFTENDTKLTTSVLRKGASNKVLELLFSKNMAKGKKL